MIFRILTVLFSCSLCAQSLTPSVAAATLNGSLAVFPLDSSQRGAEIINLFNSLYTTSYEIGFQTASNVFLPFVQSVVGTTNNTLLFIYYGAQTKANALQMAPLVLPAEQVIEIVFSINGVQIVPTNPNGTNKYGAGIVSGTLPIFSISPSQRAADILAVFSYFNKNTNNLKGNFPKMTIQTTLTGTPPNQTTPFNGSVSWVTNVILTPGTTNGTFLQITYLPNNLQPAITINVASEQVSGIVFSKN